MTLTVGQRIIVTDNDHRVGDRSGGNKADPARGAVATTGGQSPGCNMGVGHVALIAGSLGPHATVEPKR